MADHGPTGARLNPTFVGNCTFGKNPCVPDRDTFDADVAAMGTQAMLTGSRPEPITT